MHPDRAFAWDDEAGLRTFLAARSFALICMVVDGRVGSAQAPLSIAADGTIAFHLARRNPLSDRLDGAAVLASVVGDDAYISPDWYGSADQVPTWNYRMAEIEGVARRLSLAELHAQLDDVSAIQEAMLAPKPAWTRAKMSPPRLTAMVGALAGFAIDAPILRGVAKLGQNKRAAETAGAIAALRHLGRDGMADAMEQAR